jgi:hypothetical protein
MINYNEYTPIEEVLSNMVEIKFPNDDTTEGFRKVKETLQRMGVPSKTDNILYQSCHIFHKRGQYYIAHFKEMFAADGRKAELTDGDLARRNLVVKYLTDWQMIEPIGTTHTDVVGNPRMLKVLKHHERDQWTLSPKYSIGVKH